MNVLWIWTFAFHLFISFLVTTGTEPHMYPGTEFLLWEVHT